MDIHARNLARLTERRAALFDATPARVRTAVEEVIHPQATLAL